MARVAGCDLLGDLHNKCCGHCMCFASQYGVLAWLLTGELAVSVPDLQQNLIRAKVTE